jgi:hypothetical protein
MNLLQLVRRAALVKDLLARFDSTTDSDIAAYFLGRPNVLQVPPRAGYVLGLRVAEAVASETGASVQEMAHWTHEQAKPRIRAALESMAN